MCKLLFHKLRIVTNERSAAALTPGAMGIPCMHYSLIHRYAPVSMAISFRKQSSNQQVSDKEYIYMLHYSDAKNHTVFRDKSPVAQWESQEQQIGKSMQCVTVMATSGWNGDGLHLTIELPSPYPCRWHWSWVSLCWAEQTPLTGSEVYSLCWPSW